MHPEEYMDIKQVGTYCTPSLREYLDTVPTQTQASQNQRLKLGNLRGASASIPTKLSTRAKICVLSACQPQQDLNFK